MAIKERRCARLTQDEIDRLLPDLQQRQILRSVMAENSLEVLSMEFCVAAKTIIRIDQRNGKRAQRQKLPLETMRAIYRRRRVYWSARQIHDDHYSKKQIMSRYNISSETFLRWLQVMQDKQSQRSYEASKQEWRKVA